MVEFLPTIILRHRKENLKKCSLRGLEEHPGFQFFTYPCKEIPSLENYLLLTLDAPVLSEEDHSLGLFLIDATWNYAPLMQRQLPLSIQKRSLPAHLRTAYPRKQTGCADPDRGLASIEALFAAYTLLGRNTEGLLDNFHWKQQFLKLNPLLTFQTHPSKLVMK